MDVNELVPVVQMDWEERVTCSSFHKIAEFHLQLLPRGHLEELFRSLGLGSVRAKANPDSGKSHTFLDVNGNAIEWKNVIELLTNHQLNDLNEACWKHYQGIFRKLELLKNDLTKTNDEELSSALTSDEGRPSLTYEEETSNCCVVTMRDILRLPNDVLKDLSVLRGVASYSYGRNQYVYRLYGEDVDDQIVIGRSVLLTRLTRVYFVSYINYIMQKLLFSSEPYTSNGGKNRVIEHCSFQAADENVVRGDYFLEMRTSEGQLIQYDRDFLLQLRYTTFCTTKPPGLPSDIEVILNESHVPTEDDGMSHLEFNSQSYCMPSVNQRNWDERLSGCDAQMITELHLQLLAPRSVRTLYTVMGFGYVTTKLLGSRKVHQFMDIDDNEVPWTNVVELLTNVQVGDLNLSSIQNFQVICTRLTTILSALLESPEEISVENVLQLPGSVLTDISVLRGLGHYRYGRSGYVHEMKGVNVNDLNNLGKLLLSTGLTKVDFQSYIKNIVKRLEMALSVKDEKLKGEWEQRMAPNNSCGFSEIHLNLLPSSSIKQLYVRQGFALVPRENPNNLESKIHHFVNIENLNHVESNEVVASLLGDLGFGDLDRISIREFLRIHKMLEYVRDTSDATSQLLTQDLLQLPVSVLRDLSVLRGVGCYRYSANCYADRIHGDEKDMATHILATGLTKSDFIAYIDNMMLRLDEVKKFGEEILQRDWFQRIRGDICDSVSELHLQLLTASLGRSIYETAKLGFIERYWKLTESEGKDTLIHQFVDLNGNFLFFENAIKQIEENATVQDFSPACLRNFTETYEMVKDVKDRLVDPLNYCDVLTTEDILLLPSRVLRDLCIVRGVTCAHYGPRYYIYERLTERNLKKSCVETALVGKKIRHEWASLLLLTDLTKSDFLVYLDNMLKRLSSIPSSTSEWDMDGGSYEEPTSCQTGREEKKLRAKLIDMFDHFPTHDILVDAITSLVSVNDLSKVQFVTMVIFEKAIMEPRLTSDYAKLCSSLAEIWSAAGFRKILLDACQNEFEKSDDCLEFALNTTGNGPEKENEGVRREREVRYAVFKNRRQRMGNLRLIGELFKLKMLSEPIVHVCMSKLLQKLENEPSSEDHHFQCFCVFLKSIGGLIDRAKAKSRMDKFFLRVLKLVESKKLSSEMEAALQEILDLRENKWVVEPNGEMNLSSVRCFPLCHWKEQSQGPPNEPMFSTKTFDSVHSRQSFDPMKFKFFKKADMSLVSELSLGPAGRPGGWSKGAGGGGGSRNGGY